MITWMYVCAALCFVVGLVVLAEGFVVLRDSRRVYREALKTLIRARQTLRTTEVVVNAERAVREGDVPWL